MITLIVLLILIGIIGFVWFDEIRTLLSIKEIMPKNKAKRDGYVYDIQVFGNYYLEDFIDQGGLKSDRDLIDFMSKKITRGFFKLSVEESTIGCSSFYVKDKSGDNLFARNYDMTETNVALVKTNPKGRYRSISSIDLNFLGVDYERGIQGLKDKINLLAAAYTPLDGINEKGVSVGVYMSNQGPGDSDIGTDQESDKPDLTTTVLLRMILDCAGNLEEAIDIAKSYNMHDSASSSYHYMVADAYGKSAILEYIGQSNMTDTDGSKRDLKVIYKEDPTSLAGSDKYQIVTNFIVYPNYYQEGEDKTGLDRYQEIKGQLDKAGGILENEEAAMDILESVGRRDWGDQEENFITTHSVVYNNSNKTSYWVGNEHYGEEEYIYRYDFD